MAKDAVAFAAQEGYDVVLIDTAGRRHNDQRLMSSLEKFAKFARPDKILMVGEVRFAGNPRQTNSLANLMRIGAGRNGFCCSSQKFQFIFWSRSNIRWVYYF